MITYNGKFVRSASGKWVVKPTAPQHEAVIGGKTYPTVTMPDGKEWLAVNLDFAYTGLSIPTSGASLTSTPQAMYYNYDESTYGWDGYKCGLLYNWYAVDYMEQNKATLFPGWHVPSRAEWNDLFVAIGTDAGKKLKAVDGSAGTNWPSDWGGTDDYQFAALPGGRFHLNGFSAPFLAVFWTTTEKETEPEWAYYAALSRYSDSAEAADYNYGFMEYQYSVRLVKDA